VDAEALQAARESQVVLLAVPIYATLDWMEQLAPVLGPEHLVTDVGSTKAQITAAAARLFNTPDRAAFLPGHPMAGKERGGAALGDANLFRGAVWLFTDDPVWQRSQASAALVKDWREWVGAMGSKTIDIDAARHDELVGWVSHLPQFVATALSALLEEEVGDAPELKDVGGRALREMTRLGASPYSMWRDIAHTNTAAVEAALYALEQRLAHLRENLRTADLRDEFEKANRFRRE
jgi:prephenate dehydrogenase